MRMRSRIRSESLAMIVATAVVIGGCGGTSSTNAEPFPTTTTTASTTSTSLATTSTSSTTTSTTLAVDPSEVAEYTRLIDLVAPHTNIPETAPHVECDRTDPETVRSLLEIEDGYSPPVDEIERPGECGWVFGDFLGDGVSVSTVTDAAPQTGHAAANIPRIYDALAREIFERDFVDLTHGEAATISALTLAAAQLPDTDDCDLSIVGNNAEFLQDLTCLSTMYTRTYQDGSTVTIWAMTGLEPTKPLEVDFGQLSALMDYLDSWDGSR